MCKVILLIASMAFLGACAATPSPVIQLVEVNQPFPSSLVVPCEDYTKFNSSDIESVIITHSENMEKAITCRNRANQLIEIIQER